MTAQKIIRRSACLKNIVAELTKIWKTYNVIFDTKPRQVKYCMHISIRPFTWLIKRTSTRFRCIGDRCREFPRTTLKKTNDTYSRLDIVLFWAFLKKWSLEANDRRKIENVSW